MVSYLLEQRLWERISWIGGKHQPEEAEQSPEQIMLRNSSGVSAPRLGEQEQRRHNCGEKQTETSKGRRAQSSTFVGWKDSTMM